MLMKKFGVKGYPSFYFIKNKQKIEYRGSRHVDQMREWILLKSSPQAFLLDEDSLKEIQKERVSLALFHPKEDSEGLQIYEEAVLYLDNIKCGHSPSLFLKD